MRAVLLLVAFVTVACSDSSPVAPTPPPTPVSPLPLPSSLTFISVVGDQWIPVTSGPVQMTARLYPTPFEYFDGAEYVTWSVDPPGILSVDKQGRVTPMASGQVDVVAAAGGRVGRNRVRVLPDYSGTWTGRHRLTACDGLPDPRTCGRSMFDASTGAPVYSPLTLRLSQDRDQVGGILASGQSGFESAVTGYVRQSGTLVLEATISQAQFGIEPRRLLNWSSTLNASSTVMSGGYTWITPGLTSFGTRYTGRTEYEFTDLARAP